MNYISASHFHLHIWWMMNDDLHLVSLVPVQLGSSSPSVQLMKLFHSDHDLCHYWYLSWTLAVTPWLPYNGLPQLFNLVPLLSDHGHLYNVAFFPYTKENVLFFIRPLLLEWNGYNFVFSLLYVPYTTALLNA